MGPALLISSAEMSLHMHCRSAEVPSSAPGANPLLIAAPKFAPSSLCVERLHPQRSLLANVCLPMQPKFQCAVPFTPVTGPRVLIKNAAEQHMLLKAAAQTLIALTGGVPMLLPEHRHKSWQRLIVAPRQLLAISCIVSESPKASVPCQCAFDWCAQASPHQGGCLLTCALLCGCYERTWPETILNVGDLQFLALPV